MRHHPVSWPVVSSYAVLPGVLGIVTAALHSGG
jgi:hypothetical protein